MLSISLSDTFSQPAKEIGAALSDHSYYKSYRTQSFGG